MSHIKKLSPLVGESVSGADERGKCEQTCKRVSYRTVLNTGLVILERSEESRQRLEILNVFLAGFFAPSDNLFFLLSSFRFYPSLKNDGRGALGFSMIF